MAEPGYRTILDSVAFTRSSKLEVFSDFCRISACALSLCSREDEYRTAINKYPKEDQRALTLAFATLVEEMEDQPFTDILGPYYLDIASHSSKIARGEFFTPPSISKLIAQMVFDVEAVKNRGLPVTVSEPACGSGTMVLAVAELFAPGAIDLLRVTCQDINPVAADMCYINTSLWGIPARVVLGNTLGAGDLKSWANLHWRRVGEDQRLAAQRMLSIAAETTPTPSTDKQAAPSPFREVNGQFELNLGAVGCSSLGI